MDVDVRHRLSCRWAVLDAEGQRVASEVLLDFLPHLLCQLPQIRHLLPSQIAEAMRHPLRTDQHVSCPRVKPRLPFLVAIPGAIGRRLTKA